MAQALDVFAGRLEIKAGEALASHLNAYTYAYAYYYYGRGEGAF
jgi:hypothetical protein